MTTALVAAVTNQVTNYKTREAWLEARKRGIGASDSSALFGINPYASRYSLWAEKSGVAPSELWTGEQLERLEWGNLLETPIALRYEQKTGRKLWHVGDYCIAQHPSIECMLATPDRFITEAPDRRTFNTDGLLQIKCSADEEAWRNGPPVYYQCQVQHEMAVTGRRWACLAVLLNGNSLRWWDIERNDDFIAELEAECQAFWQTVPMGPPPPVDGHKATLSALKRMHPLDNNETIDLGDEFAAYMDTIKRCKETIKQLEGEAEAAEANIRAAIGPASFARLPGGRTLSLKHTTIETRTQIVPGYTFRTLRELKAKPVRVGPKKGPRK